MGRKGLHAGGYKHNRLIAAAGYNYGYDSAGNQTNDTYTGAGARTYDAENRMSTAWGGNNQSQVYNYNADGQRTRRKVDGVETWQIYGMDGELVAEYAANGLATSPQKEYGYRNGQLLVTAEALLTEQNVSWTSVTSTLQVTGNSLQKISGTSSWYDAGAVSTQSITSGDGYVEFTPGNTTTWRMIGLGNGNTGIHYSDIEYALFVGPSGGLQIYEAGILRGSFGTYAGADRLRVAVEGGVVKYRKNGALVYTSTVAPTYPLLVDTSFNTVNSAVYNVMLATSSNGGVKWLVTDQLGTPRMIFDKTGALATTKRHDYLPFGEELFAGQGSRTTTQGYPTSPNSNDAVRQKFTQKERDNETGLDFFEARYYASTQGRFTSVDPLAASAHSSEPQSWNRYSYSYNNPLRFSDPSGMAPGDYYDQQGNWIGMDYLDDRKNYLVTNQAETQQIQQDTNNGRAVSTPADYTSLLELPEQGVRQEAGVAAVARSNSPTGGNTPTDDRRGGFHEEGGGVIQTANGQVPAPALPGPVQDPRSTNPATLNPLNTSNATAQMISSSATSADEVTFYHVHPSGTRSTGTGVAFFVQPPSQPDRDFAAANPTTLGYHIVVGAGASQVVGQNTGGRTVYFYNGTRTLGTMPLNRFVNLPPRRPLPPFRP